jgi:hypothetical protein
MQKTVASTGAILEDKTIKLNATELGCEGIVRVQLAQEMV